MIVLDTDHVSILSQRTGSALERLRRTLVESLDREIAIGAPTLEEVVHGWMSKIRQNSDPYRQVPYYENFVWIFRFFENWRILPFDIIAADTFATLKRSAGTVAAMDLKIASIALVNDALLLTSNFKHFSKVPGLRIEDWVHGS